MYSCKTNPIFLNLTNGLKNCSTRAATGKAVASHRSCGLLNSFLFLCARITNECRRTQGPSRRSRSINIRWSASTGGQRVRQGILRCRPRASHSGWQRLYARLGCLLYTRTKSGQRIAIARRSLAAVAHACHAMCAGCGWLRRLADATRSLRLPNARPAGLYQTKPSAGAGCPRSLAHRAAR